MSISTTLGMAYSIWKYAYFISALLCEYRLISFFIEIQLKKKGGLFMSTDRYNNNYLDVVTSALSVIYLVCITLGLAIFCMIVVSMI